MLALLPLVVVGVVVTTSITVSKTLVKARANKQATLLVPASQAVMVVVVAVVVKTTRA